MKRILLALFLTTSMIHGMEKSSNEENSLDNARGQNLKKSLPYTDPSHKCNKADVSVLETYFTEISKSIASYRVFTIWATGEKKLLSGYKSYIGGTDKDGKNSHAINWFNMTHSFLEASKKFTGKFVFEIILDEKTINDNSENIEILQNHFLNSIVVTSLDTVLNDVQSKVSVTVFSLLEHLKEGNPAIGSDILRTLKLYDSQYDLNVYCDPDSFVRQLRFSQSGYKPKSEQKAVCLTYKDLFKGELDAAKKMENEIFRMQYSYDGNCNDYLISKGNTQGKLANCIKTFEKFLKQNDGTINVLNWHKLRSNYFSNYSEYSRKLDEIFVKITEIFKENKMFKARIIDFNNAVTSATGPDSSLFGLFKNIYKEPVLLESRGTWTTQRIFLNVVGFDNFCGTMGAFYPKDATEILTLIWKARWMINDWDAMMLTGEQHIGVAKELQRNFLGLMKQVTNLTQTAELSDQGKGIKKFRDLIIPTLNATFESDKIWFSNFENKLYLLEK